MLTEVEQVFFRASEQSRSNDEQQRTFEALLEYRRNRSDVLPRFFAALESHLACLPELQLKKAEDNKRFNLTSDSMSLLEDDRLEETIVLHELAARAEIRNSGELYLLGHRFAVLAEKPFLDEDHLPLGPHILCECIRYAQAGLDIPVSQRVMIFRVFEAKVLSKISKVYEAINRFLVENRILPNFSVASIRQRRSAGVNEEALPDEQVEESISIEDRAAPNKSKRGSNEGANNSPPMQNFQSGTQNQNAQGAHGSQTAHSQGLASQNFQSNENPNEGSSQVGRRMVDQPAFAEQQSAAPLEYAESNLHGSWDELIDSAFSNPLVGWPGTNIESESSRNSEHAFSSRGAAGSTRPSRWPLNAGASGDPQLRAGSSSVGAFQSAQSQGLGFAQSGSNQEVPAFASGDYSNSMQANNRNDSAFSQPNYTQNNQPLDRTQESARVHPGSGPVFFEELRDLLGRRRQNDGIVPTMPTNAHAVNSDDVQSVLGLMQMKPQQPIMQGGRLVQKGVSHLKQDLLNQLRRVTPEGKQPQLEAADSDTFDLVGMMFEQLQKEVPARTGAHGFINKLQVPLLRVALNDKTFFTERAHPARRMLNTIGETTMFWLDDTEQDKELVDKMHVMVDRVASEFNGDVKIFEQMLQDLHQHLNLLGRKSEVSERRQVETARGREKLDVARATALEAIGSRLAAKPNLGELIKALLEQAWTDVLALTVLRNGVDGALYKARLGVADRLIDLETLDDSHHRMELFKSIRDDLESGLLQVGYHSEDIERLFAVLLGPEKIAEINDQSPVYRELAPKIKSKARLGAHGNDLDTHRKAVEKRADLLAKLSSPEINMLERLKRLPFGTWFEFMQADGTVSKRKLSWFSTITGNALFVNQRGVKTDETSIEEVARGLVSGRVKVVEKQKETLIDRAWRSIMNTLRLMAIPGVDNSFGVR